MGLDLVRFPRPRCFDLSIVGDVWCQSAAICAFVHICAFVFVFVYLYMLICNCKIVFEWQKCESWGVRVRQYVTFTSAWGNHCPSWEPVQIHPNSSPNKNHFSPYKIGPDSLLTIDGPILKSALNQLTACPLQRQNPTAEYFSNGQIPSFDKILLIWGSLFQRILIQFKFQVFDRIFWES